MLNLKWQGSIYGKKQTVLKPDCLGLRENFSCYINTMNTWVFTVLIFTTEELQESGWMLGEDLMTETQGFPCV